MRVSQDSWRLGLLLWVKLESTGGIWVVSLPFEEYWAWDCFVLFAWQWKCQHVLVFRVTISHYLNSSFLVEKSVLLSLLHWVSLQVVEKFGLKTCISQMTPIPGGMMWSLPAGEKGENQFTWNSNLFLLSKQKSMQMLSLWLCIWNFP